MVGELKWWNLCSSIARCDDRFCFGTRQSHYQRIRGNQHVLDDILDLEEHARGVAIDVIFVSGSIIGARLHISVWTMRL